MSDRTVEVVDALTLPDPEGTVRSVAERILHAARRFRRRGAVVALSGGIDSAVTAALCVRAFGRQSVLGLLMPEIESSADSLILAQQTVAALGIGSVVEDITDALRAVRAYQRRDEALRRVVPGYGPGWRAKLVLPDLLGSQQYRITAVVAEAPDGTVTRRRLPAGEYREVVAATNFKQRLRKTLEYYHADRLNYAVIGTPNRLEYELGFFVKNGDGSADIKPIAHLYKSQVYQLAEWLGVPEAVRTRAPTTDTYTLPQTQDEFYFALPLRHMDLCLYALDNGVPARAVSDALDLSVAQVERVFADIAAKRLAGAYLHAVGKPFDEAS